MWKFQPPSGKDSQKRSATRHKNPQSRADSRAPEFAIFGHSEVETLVSGIADAVPLDANNRIEAVVDWKSDVEMSMAKLAGCKAQLCDYRKQTGAKRALLVLMKRLTKELGAKCAVQVSLQRFCFDRCPFSRNRDAERLKPSSTEIDLQATIVAIANLESSAGSKVRFRQGRTNRLAICGTIEMICELRRFQKRRRRSSEIYSSNLAVRNPAAKDPISLRSSGENPAILRNALSTSLALTLGIVIPRSWASAPSPTVASATAKTEEAADPSQGNRWI